MFIHAFFAWLACLCLIDLIYITVNLDPREHSTPFFYYPWVFPKYFTKPIFLTLQPLCNEMRVLCSKHVWHLNDYF